MSLILILVLVSLLVSTLGTIVGFGGGIFLVPILVTFFHYPLHLAVGSVMIALVPSAILTTFFNSQKGMIDFKTGILLELPTIAGTIFGSFLLAWITVRKLEEFFALGVMLLGVSFLIKKNTKNTSPFFTRLNRLPPRFVIKNRTLQSAYKASLWVLLAFGGFAGTIAGLFGVGGGFLKTPILIKVIGMPVKVAAGTGLFMIVITSITGSITHYMLGHIIWEKSWPIMLGFVLGALVGKIINTNLKDKLIGRLIGMSLLIVSLIMMVDFFIERY